MFVSEDSLDKASSAAHAAMLAGEDTDMRQPMMCGVDDARLQVIHSNATEQLKSGNISSDEYNKILEKVR